MKSYKYFIGVALFSLSLTSCYDLELQPKGVLDESVLTANDNGIKKYLAGIYNDLPIEDFNFFMNEGYPNHSNQYWEANKYSISVASGEGLGRSDFDMGENFEYWPYGRIRDINVFLSAIETSKNKYTEEQYKEYLGEGHFLRAYYYFGLAKRYGGVPLIDEVLDPTADLNTLQIARSTEYDTWKHIYDDLKFAMENASSDKTSKHRATRYTAAALMSRTMLYAGRIAKYGKYAAYNGPASQAGLMGMSDAYAQEFFQYAYDACKFLQQAGYKLHTGADKETAFVEVFTKDETEEDIFVKAYGADATTPFETALKHSYDAMTLPLGDGMSTMVGCALQPSFDLVGLYDMPAITDEDGKPVRFNSLDDLWKSSEMEPRAKATVFFSGMTEPVSKQVLNIQAGYYKSYPGTTSDGAPENTDNEYTQTYRVRAQKAGVTEKDGTPVSGKYGYATGVGDESYSYSGMIIRKYVTADASKRSGELYKSNQPWKVFRYGEILCNWAEASYELGLISNNEMLKQEAFLHVAELRDRAGAKPHGLVASPVEISADVNGYAIDENLQFIRQERQRELAFENQGYWDLRTWRVFDARFKNFWAHCLMGYYVKDEKKYIFLPEVNPFGRQISFNKNQYYKNIPGYALLQNPKLVRNDGY